MDADNAFDPVYRGDCPSRAILDQIADKWSMLVLAVLREPRRFNAIKRRLDGITQRVLTQTLRKLERNGMVTRKVIDGPKLGVEYGLTELGKSLQQPFAHLYNWTVEHMDEIVDQQRRYDARWDDSSIPDQGR
jgi:DNA-binding HxlR family transcriptional regulator